MKRLLVLPLLCSGYLLAANGQLCQLLPGGYQWDTAQPTHEGDLAVLPQEGQQPLRLFAHAGPLAVAQDHHAHEDTSCCGYVASGRLFRSTGAALPS